jgi:hypothetical protein
LTIARRFNAGIKAENDSSPAGTAEFLNATIGGGVNFIDHSTVPPGRKFLRDFPGVETPGYCRNVPLGQNKTALRRGPEGGG